MSPVDELRKKVAKRKHLFVMLCVIAASQVAFGSFIVHFVFRHGVRLHETFALLVPVDSSAVFVHPVLMTVLGVWILVQGIYIFIAAIANMRMTMERALLEHIDGDS